MAIGAYWFPVWFHGVLTTNQKLTNKAEKERLCHVLFYPRNHMAMGSWYHGILTTNQNLIKKKRTEEELPYLCISTHEKDWLRNTLDIPSLNQPLDSSSRSVELTTNRKQKRSCCFIMCFSTPWKRRLCLPFGSSESYPHAALPWNRIVFSELSM
jgi:hypothetical protein